MAGAFRGQAQNGGGAFAQAQSPSDRLLDRGYLDKVPPVTTRPRVTTPETDKIWQDYALPRVEVLKRLGVPGHEAWDLISEMPDVQEMKRKAYENNTLPPDFEDLLRR
jgi:hypothetical protein